MLSNRSIVTTLPAVDLQRARNFYEEKLGLGPPYYSSDNDVTYETAQGNRLYLYKRAQTKADHTAFSFQVDDVSKEVKELEEKGVEFEIPEMPGMKIEGNIASWDRYKVAWFKDSEGNIIALTEGF